LELKAPKLRRLPAGFRSLPYVKKEYDRLLPPAVLENA